MKKHGILNSSIASVLAHLGHEDYIVISDCGLPIPSSVPRIDLCLRLGAPSFQEVCKLLFHEMIIERAYLAEEIRKQNPLQNDFVQRTSDSIPIEYMSHKKFKQMTATAKAIIRTGEATPYSNIILQSGVVFCHSS